jgi:perosamine synthetase
MNRQNFIPVAEPCLDGNELAYVVDCVQSGWVSSLGTYIQRFEEEFAAFCGTSYAVATSNGTTALHLALAVLGIGPGDEVIVPTLSFVATANAVAYTGAKPVFVDSEPYTWNINPELIRKKITPRTKAIIPVHLYGHPADMKPILEIAAQGDGHSELFVIEDAAEAHGALYNGRRVGSLGCLNAFSFYGNKIITTGEGGMLTTSDESLAQSARFLRDHAMSPEKRYWHPQIGYNYRLTNIQAALGLAQIESINRFMQRKRQIAQTYNTLLAGIPGIILPPEADWATSVYWMYSILITEDYPLSRDELRAYLSEQGIDSRPFFYPIHTMPPYDAGERHPVAEKLSQQGINLPSSVKLTDDDLHRIADAICHPVFAR